MFLMDATYHGTISGSHRCQAALGELPLVFQKTSLHDGHDPGDQRTRLRCEEQQGDHLPLSEREEHIYGEQKET